MLQTAAQSPAEEWRTALGRFAEPLLNALERAGTAARQMANRARSGDEGAWDALWEGLGGCTWPDTGRLVQAAPAAFATEEPSASDFEEMAQLTLGDGMTRVLLYSELDQFLYVTRDRAPEYPELTLLLFIAASESGLIDPRYLLLHSIGTEWLAGVRVGAGVDLREECLFQVVEVPARSLEAADADLLRESIRQAAEVDPASLDSWRTWAAAAISMETVNPTIRKVLIEIPELGLSQPGG